MTMNRFALTLTTLFLVGCGSEKDASDALPVIDNTAEVLAFYDAHADFFRERSIEELPENLVWEDGADLPEVGSADAKKGGTEYVRLADFPRTLRTVGPDSNGSFRPWILDNTSMAMAHRHPETLDYFPGLALRWAVDTESKSVFVELDPKATWSDGVPITADDYRFTFWFYRTRYITAPWYNNWYESQYTGITKYSDHLISISIPELKPDTDSKVLELRPLPQHFYKEVGEDFLERYQWRFAPTSAAYILKDEDLKKGRSVRLTRDKNWWAADKKHWRYRFNVDHVNLTVIRDNAKVFEAFKRGDIDQFGLDLAEFWYEKLPETDPDVAAGYIEKKWYFNERPRPPYGLWINTHQGLLADQNIRLGIQHATHWQLVIDQFFRGDYSRLKTANDGYGPYSHPDIKARDFDIERAMAYFQAAGFNQRGPDGILERGDGTRLAFTVSSGYESLKDVLTILKEEAAKAGLEFRVEVLDATAGWKKVQEKQHDIHFSAFGYSLELYPRFWETFHSDNAYDKAFLDNGAVNPDRKPKPQTNNLETLAIQQMDESIIQ
jgi:microcin C transport system substrate-binding protein